MLSRVLAERFTVRAKALLYGFVERFLPRGAGHLPPGELQRLRLAVVGCLLSASFTAFVAGGLYLKQGLTSYVQGLLLSLSLLTAHLFLIRWYRSSTLPGALLILWLQAILIVQSGGTAPIELTNIQWLALVPLSASILVGPRLALLCTATSSAHMARLTFLSAEAAPIDEKVLTIRTNGLVMSLAMGLFATFYGIYRRKAEASQVDAADRQVRNERVRADVGAALAGDAPLAAVLQRCCEAMVQHLDVAAARIWTLPARGDTLELMASASHGAAPPDALHLVARQEQPLLTDDLRQDPRLEDEDWARREGLVAFASYPLLVGEKLTGVMALYAARALHGDTLAALRSLADTLAHGIERKHAEQALAERVRELARSNTDLEQFAYVASHDLQEPLRMVSSYTQLLALRYHGKLDTDADEFIGFAVNGAKRMQHLILDLLAYSRVGTRGLCLTSVDSRDVLERVLAHLHASVVACGARIDADPLPVVRADEVQLERLFENLISNALTFRARDVPPRIHVSAQRRDEGWVFSVRDNGIGIEPQYFQRIFVIFKRLHGRGEHEGTGIGLATCKKIVELHGGRIWVESTPGQGSTFSFTLPGR